MKKRVGEILNPPPNRWAHINEGVPATDIIACERIKLSTETKSFGFDVQGTLS